MRRWIVVLGVCGVVAGLAAYLYYFAWAAPLLDPDAIDRFAYGPQGVNILEYEERTRAEDGETLERILSLVNGAPLSREAVERSPDRFQLVLYREDGLKYFLYLDGPRAVGISEGDQSYLGSLDSPELVALLRELEERAGSRSGEG